VSDELLQKVVDRTNVASGSGGLLNTDQQNRFIDYMWDETALLSTARTIRMRSNTQDIDKIGVGKKLLRVATEAVDDGVNAGVTFSKISITTTKFRLDWEISTESLEDNIEGDALEDHIARLMAAQVGNDLEDVAINGNDTLTGDALYKAFDGYRTLALGGAHVVSAAGAAVTRATFNKAIKAMPRKYKQRRAALRFYAGSNTVQDFIYAQTVTSDTLINPYPTAIEVVNGRGAVQGSAGGQYPFAFGVPVLEIPLFSETLAGTYSGASGDHANIELTFPDNRLVGIKRDITVYREFEPKKDTTEFTVYTRMGVAIENLDAYVVVTDVKQPVS